MSIAVRYYTRSGNTEKLAHAIAAALKVEAKELSCPLEERVDILFLGSSFYGFDVDPKVKEFIKCNKDNIGRIACFGTAAMLGSTRKRVKKVAAPLGVEVMKEEFHCLGQFGKAHPGRPNENDLQAAAEFAKSVK